MNKRKNLTNRTIRSVFTINQISYIVLLTRKCTTEVSSSHFAEKLRQSRWQDLVENICFDIHVNFWFSIQSSILLAA